MSTDWSDKKEVLRAVSENAFALQNASDELKSDREVVIGNKRVLLSEED